MKDFLQSQKFKWVLGTLGAIILLLFTFQLGVFVGIRKANFAFKWAGAYHKNFGGPEKGFMRDFEGKDFMNTNGTAGEVIKIETNKVTIKSKNETEKVILVGETTQIKKGIKQLTLKEILLNDKIVVIGTPLEDGTISAKLVRIFSPGETETRRSFKMPFNQ
jgi:hypothetical protein